MDKTNENKLVDESLPGYNAPNFRGASSCYTCDNYDHPKYECKKYYVQKYAWSEPWNKICDSHTILKSEKEL
jgi:hypothetical protein